MNKKKICKCLAITLAVLSLAGCGSSLKTASSTDTSKYQSYANTGNSYDPMVDNDTSYDYASEETAAEVMDSGDSMGVGSADFSSDIEIESDAKSVSSNSINADDQKLIYSGNITIQTLEYDDSLKQLKKLIKDDNGFIETQYESNSNYDWYYDNDDGNDLRNIDIKARIPSDKFNDFMESLSDLGQVMDKSTSTDNITRTYNDNDASIAALEKEQQRLLEMMDKATTVDEMISVENRLTTVETELNQAKSNKSSMDSDIKYSTISISLQEVNKYSEVTKPVKYGEKLLKALKNSWNNLLVFFQELLIIILYILPFALVFLVIILIIKAVRKKKGKDTRLFHKKDKNLVNNTVENIENDKAENIKIR